jgi:hypothetical protein
VEIRNGIEHLLNESLMEYLVPETLSKPQLDICLCKVSGCTYTDITMRFPQLYNRHISKYLLRASLGYRWDVDSENGRPTYLGEFDECVLISIIHKEENNLHPLRINFFIQLAFEQKLYRYRQAQIFLSVAHCDQLLAKVRLTQPLPPCRGWVNDFAVRNHFQLKLPRPIDELRLTSAIVDKIKGFFSAYETFFKSFRSNLIFGADETMIDDNKLMKVITSLTKGTPIQVKEIENSHISVMLSHNAFGIHLPPFIILPKLQKLDQNLSKLTDNQLLWIASSESGWENRSTFLIWAVHFCHYLSSYRATLSKNPENDLFILLLLDGHSSRESSAALQLFKIFNIFVLILPSYLTHLLQWFDVG